jgi:hypothetical protein
MNVRELDGKELFAVNGGGIDDITMPSGFPGKLDARTRLIKSAEHPPLERDPRTCCLAADWRRLSC